MSTAAAFGRATHQGLSSNSSHRLDGQQHRDAPLSQETGWAGIGTSLVDGLGSPLHVHLSPGSIHDITEAPRLIERRGPVSGKWQVQRQLILFRDEAVHVGPPERYLRMQHVVGPAS